MIDDAANRMRRIADVLLDVFENRLPSRPAPVARRSVLTEVIPPGDILDASSDLARTFVELLEGG